MIMPGHCCVPRCRGNYDGGESVRVFTFPSDPARRTQWIKAIHRADFTPGNRSVVCERHSKPSDMVDSTSYVDTKTGKVIEAKLKLDLTQFQAYCRTVLLTFPPQPQAHVERPHMKRKRVERQLSCKMPSKCPPRRITRKGKITKLILFRRF